jgi:hypothetical protein
LCVRRDKGFLAAFLSPTLHVTVFYQYLFNCRIIFTVTMKRAAPAILPLAICLCMISIRSFGNERPLPARAGYADSVSYVIDMNDLLQEILSVTGLKVDFILKSADVLNMEATVSKRKRYIFYNPGFVRWLAKATHDKWAALTLLAHEVGHHLNGHTIRRGGSRPSVELEADEFAGFVMARLGATLQQAQEVMKYVATIEGSETHPGRQARMDAIERGWMKSLARE